MIGVSLVVYGPSLLVATVSIDGRDRYISTYGIGVCRVWLRMCIDGHDRVRCRVVFHDQCPSFGSCLIDSAGAMVIGLCHDDVFCDLCAVAHPPPHHGISAVLLFFNYSVQLWISNLDPFITAIIKYATLRVLNFYAVL